MNFFSLSCTCIHHKSPFTLKTVCHKLKKKKKVLYSTKGGSLARNHRGTSFGASVVLQQFFGMTFSAI